MSVFKKKIKKKYLPEIQKRMEAQRTVARIAETIEGNSALFNFEPGLSDGQRAAKLFNVLADLFQQENNEYLAKVLMICGFPLKDKIYDIAQDGTVTELPPQPPQEPHK